MELSNVFVHLGTWVSMVCCTFEGVPGCSAEVALGQSGRLLRMGPKVISFMLAPTLWDQVRRRLKSLDSCQSWVKEHLQVRLPFEQQGPEPSGIFLVRILGIKVL